ncbi:YezD family protein [Sporosarcina sp. FSL K6-2383]
MGNQKGNVELAIDKVQEMLKTMNYGSITLVVQDNVVIQIEKNEKIRLK